MFYLCTYWNHWPKIPPDGQVIIVHRRWIQGLYSTPYSISVTSLSLYTFLQDNLITFSSHPKINFYSKLWILWSLCMIISSWVHFGVGLWTVRSEMSRWCSPRGGPQLGTRGVGAAGVSKRWRGRERGGGRGWGRNVNLSSSESSFVPGILLM